MLQTAIILAGGFGTRLQKVVNDLPKPMAPVNGEPFLNYQLNYLKHFGIKRVVLSVGYLADKIQDYYKSTHHGIEINYAVENMPMGTGGGTRIALEKCPENEILILNGDSFFDVNLSAYYDLHRKEKSEISLALRKVNDSSRYGTIETNTNHRIISFKEKTNNAAEGSINGGVYILNKALYLKNTPAENNFSIEKDFFEKQLNNLVIKGFEFNGYFIDIGVPEDYTKAQDDLKGFKYR
jgi:D-glycero-alpha-D-manno-heptose 1-phosphate guanylyltransferase